MTPLTFRLASVAFVLGVLCIAATWDGETETDAAARTAADKSDAINSARVAAKEQP